MRTRRIRLQLSAIAAALAALAAFAALVYADGPAQSAALPLDLPVVTLDRVLPRSGNNPFDSRDPLAPIAPRGSP